MTDEELQEMIDEADRDGDGEISEEGIFCHKGEIIEFKELLETRKKGDVFLHTY